MRPVHCFLSLLLGSFPIASIQALPPLPAQGPAPLLHVLFVAPPEMQVTFFPGGGSVRAFPAPIAAGLRPGYSYRVKLSNIPGRPGLTLYPTLEVRGTLQMPSAVRAADHPAPIVFSPDDIDRVLKGAVLTKVVYLEHPDQAEPRATAPDLPIEHEIPPGEEPLEAARTRGRPVLIVRLGERVLPDLELASQAIPGTVLLPGEPRLPPPALPPFLPWACLPMVDPILGLKPPEEERLHDGGDVAPGVGFDRNGEMQGLDPTDTAASYADSHGLRHLAVSNRVCLIVPRFAVLKNETALVNYEAIVRLADAQARRLPQTVQSRFQSLQVHHVDQVETVRGRERLSGVEQLQHAPDVIGRIEGLRVLAKVQELRDLTSSVEEPKPADQPLHLYKRASACSAQVGEVITFYLRYANHGGRPINDVAVSDSLAGRLEYVPGSYRSSRDVVFTSQENQAGSLILHWEVSGPLLPGQNGLISFQARVR